MINLPKYLFIQGDNRQLTLPFICGCELQRGEMTIKSLHIIHLHIISSTLLLANAFGASSSKMSLALSKSVPTQSLSSGQKIPALGLGTYRFATLYFTIAVL
jgi:hypothetical protein